jgi:hypothetical protein
MGPVMHKLISGIVEFREKHLPGHAARFRELALAQSPDTLMITCSGELRACETAKLIVRISDISAYVGRGSEGRGATWCGVRG